VLHAQFRACAYELVIVADGLYAINENIMKSTFLLVATLAAASTFATACARIESSSTLTLPTTPGALSPVPAAPVLPAPAPPAGGGAYGGVWTSILPGNPSTGSCSNFLWQVTSATSNSMAGNFSATCAGNVNVVGTASGRLEGTSVPLAVAGTATYAGVVSCDFSLSGTGVIENNDTLRIPYSGLICGTAVSGTEVLHRPSPAAAEPPAPPAPPPPADPLFGCGGIPDKGQLVECIWDHVRPTDGVTAFNVTKRVAWALRGEGAGLLTKNGGDNIVAWQGHLFSVSRIVYPDGRLVKVIYDAGPGGANGPSWQDGGDYVDPSLWVAAIDPNLP
jgi:hypothetical protein